MIFPNSLIVVCMDPLGLEEVTASQGSPATHQAGNYFVIIEVDLSNKHSPAGPLQFSILPACQEPTGVA